MFSLFNKKIDKVALIDAIKKGEIEVVQTAISQGFDLNCISESEGTAVFYAIQYNRTQILELILQNGANPNSTAPKGESLFLESSLYPPSTAKNDESFAYSNLSLLLKFGAKVDVVFSTGLTLLMKAALNDDLNLAKLLVRYGANPNLKTKNQNHGFEGSDIYYCGVSGYLRSKNGWEFNATALNYAVRNSSYGFNIVNHDRKSHRVLKYFIECGGLELENVFQTYQVAIAVNDTTSLESLYRYLNLLDVSEDELAIFREQIDYGVISALYNGSIDSIKYLSNNNLVDHENLNAYLNHLDVERHQNYLHERYQTTAQQLRMLSPNVNLTNLMEAYQKFEKRFLDCLDYCSEILKLNNSKNHSAPPGNVLADALINKESSVEARLETISAVLKDHPGLLNEQFSGVHPKIDGMTPLYISLLMSNLDVDAKIPRYLLGLGANIHSSYDSLTPLQLVFTSKNKNYYNLIPLLIAAGEKYEVFGEGDDIDKDDTFSCLITSETDNTLILDILLQNGFRPKIQRALSKTIFQNLQKEFEVFLKHDIDLNLQTNSGITYLHQASLCGNLFMVKKLVEHGADWTLLTAEGLSALDVANEKNFNEICKFLAQLPPSFTTSKIKSA